MAGRLLLHLPVVTLTARLCSVLLLLLLSNWGLVRLDSCGVVRLLRVALAERGVALTGGQVLSLLAVG